MVDSSGFDEEMVPLDPNKLTENNSDGLTTPPNNGSNSVANSNQAQQQQSKSTTTVRDADGKLHRITLESPNFLEITLLNRKSQPTRHAIKIPFNVVLCVRSTRIPLRCGLPKTYPENEQQEGQEGGCCLCTERSLPNVLYVYYAYRWNVFAWRLREAALYFTSTTEKKQWAELLQNAVADRQHQPKKLLVFINPFGGKRKANGIWEKEVEPLFKMANISYEVMKTERADHALEAVRELNAARWNQLDGIISVGGDGLFNEVLYASIIRTQVAEGKNYNNAEIPALNTPRVRFGIIGAGSANSIVSSVHGVNDCPTAAIHIAIGSKCTMDVCAVYEDGNLLRFSADAISYGWLGDVLHDSERYRCLGPIRYQYSALRTSIRHPTYFGRVSFALSDVHPLPTSVASAEENSGPSSPLNIPPCTGPCEICSGQASSGELYPYHWQSDFTHVICCVIPCVSPFTPYGLAPYTGINDGTMDLALIPKVSRFKNMQIMRKVAMYGARFIRSEYPDIKVFRVSRWKFSPKRLIMPQSTAGETTEQQEEESGAWNLDGEILPQPPNQSLHFRLHPQLINYFGRDGELELDDPSYSRCCTCCRYEHKVSRLIVRTQN